jgi:nucleotide-binding universal stress UspA family protein
MPLRRRATPEQAGVRRILVGTDLSPTAERAVAWAADMAARYEAELILLRVVTGGGSKAAAETELRDYAAAVAPGARPLVKEGEDPAEVIVAAIGSEQVDVVVVGSVGMRGRRTFLLGNVPNRVSHAAGCTVVIVNTADGA